MLELITGIDCDVCHGTPAVGRLNGITVCASCAKQALELAERPRTPVAYGSEKTDDQIAVRIVELLRSRQGMTTSKEWLRLAVREPALSCVLAALVNAGRVVRNGHRYTLVCVDAYSANVAS